MPLITTVLNCYRRPQNLQEQINAVRKQVNSSESEIWIWINQHPDNTMFPFHELEGVNELIYSSRNFKYHGRFTCGLLSRSIYLAYFDDDTIPGENWYKNCLDTTELLFRNQIHRPILGSAGVILHDRRYVNHTRVGWPSMNEQVTEVDLVGHAWFFPKSVLKYLWYEEPNLDNGEDIQLSFLAQKYAQCRTFCPPHPKDDKSMWGSLRAEELGTDDVAMSNGKVISHAQFFAERDKVIEECLMRGWNTLERIK